jgi:AraC-like DNA-binding protein
MPQTGRKQRGSEVLAQAPNRTLVASFGFSHGSMSASENYEAWRQACSTFFDIDPDGRIDVDRFKADLSSYAMGTMLFGLARASAQHFSRSARTIARSGVDHVIVQLYTQGGFMGTADGITVRVEAGDICVFDLARPLETDATDFENLTLVVPRMLIEPRLKEVERLHGLVLKRQNRMARILGHHFVTLFDALPELTLDECRAINEGTLALMVACLAGEVEARMALHSGSETALMLRIRNHIERNLSDPDLSVQHLVNEFGLSRASLYRLFEPQGGIAEHIRAKRLHRALFELCAPHPGPIRISDVARRCGFPSLAAFSRAFRTVYGFTPKDARRTNFPRENPSASGPALSRWMREIAPPNDRL